MLTYCKEASKIVVNNDHKIVRSTIQVVEGLACYCTGIKYIKNTRIGRYFRLSCRTKVNLQLMNFVKVPSQHQA
jgi:hypothetical protein